MADQLRQKTGRSLFWNGVDKAGYQLIAFAVGVYAAWQLNEADFGLVGLLAIFTVLCNAFVESGFTQGLIRRPHNTREEYTAVAAFNLGVALLLYGLAYWAAPAVARAFSMPQLCGLMRLLMWAIPANALGFMQQVVLTRDLAFKQLSLANLLAGLASALLTVYLIRRGAGYRALAWQQISYAAFRSLALWFFSPWRPARKARWAVIKELFPYSVMLLITTVMSTLSKYIYTVRIGRHYQDSTLLGHYSQAQKYEQIPSALIATTLSGVAFPVLGKLNPEPERQRHYLRKLMRVAAFLIFPVMVGLWTIAPHLIPALIGPKWLPMLPYFRLLLGVGLFLPFHTLCINLAMAQGRSRVSFVLELIKNGLIFLALACFHSTVTTMLYGYLAATALSYLFDMLCFARLARYRLIAQLTDLAPYALLSLGLWAVVSLLGRLPLGLYPLCLVQILGGAAFYLGAAWLLGSAVFRDMARFVLRPHSDSAS